MRVVGEESGLAALLEGRRCLPHVPGREGRAVVQDGRGPQVGICLCPLPFLFTTTTIKYTVLYLCHRRSDGRWSEAASLLREVAGREEEAVEALVEGGCWSEADRVLALGGRKDLYGVFWG